MLNYTFFSLVVFSFFSCINSEISIMENIVEPDSTIEIIEKQNYESVISDTLPYHKFTKDELVGNVIPKTDSCFIKIDKAYTKKSNIYLRKKTYYSFCNMHAAAKKDGFDLNIVSAFRSHYHQQLIWEAKWTGRRKVNGLNLNESVKDDVKRAKLILQYSSMPGSSRHHWGTDVDIYNLNNSTFESGHGLKMYKWLQKNAADYGFYQVYTEGRETGYNEEKWHWSYLPIAKPMLDAYINNISIEDFKGFKGANTAKDVKIIQNYVLGINVECFGEGRRGMIRGKSEP